MKKLNKTLSVFLTLVMLFTTLCFFVPETEIEANAAATAYKWRVTVYMSAGSKYTDSGNVTIYWKTNNGTGSAGSAQIYSGGGDGAIWTSDGQTTYFVSDSSLSGTVKSDVVPANAFPYQATATIDIGQAFVNKAIDWEVKLEVFNSSGTLVTDSTYGNKEEHTVGWGDGKSYTSTDTIDVSYYPYVTGVTLATSPVYIAETNASAVINETLTATDQYGVSWVNNPTNITATNGVAVSSTTTKTPTITYPSALSDYSSVITTTWTGANTEHSPVSPTTNVNVYVPRTMTFDNAFNMRQWRRSGIPGSSAAISDVSDNGLTVTSTAGTDGNTGFSYDFYLKPDTTYYFTADTEFTPASGSTRGFDVYVHMRDINKNNLVLGSTVPVSGCHVEGDTYVSSTGNGADVKNVCLVFTTPSDMGYARIRFDANTSGSVLKVSNICISQYNDVTYSADQEMFAAYNKAFKDYNGLVPTPSRTGYRFQGYNWITAVGTTLYDMYCFDGVNNWVLDGAADFSVENYNAAGYGYVVPFVSQWLENQYWIGFDPNGGAGSMASVDGVYYTAETTLPASAFTRTGYTFNGWNTAQDGSGTAISDGATVSKLESVHGNWVTLYAQWTPNNYTINLNANTGTGSMSAVTATYDKDTVLPKNTFTKEGYSFANWNTAANGSGTAYSDGATVKNLLTTGALTLYAQWTINKYTITFDTLGGSAVAPITQDYNTAITAPADPTKPGYTFDGWENLPAKMPAGNVTVKAKWTANDYTITFDTDGGSAVAPITQAYNTAITAPAAPTKTGYQFAGWENLPETMPVGGMTVKAMWTANEYVINYETNGGSTVSSVTAEYDKEIELAAAPTKKGYTFTGWSVNGETYGAGAKVKNLATGGSVTVNAEWKANSYTVVFNKNDASATGSMAAQEFTYDAAEKLNDNAFVKTGYTFLGWALSSTATVADYQNGEEVINLTAAADGEVTLYALWGINTYSVTFSYKNADGTDAQVVLGAVEHGTALSDIVPEYPEYYYNETTHHKFNSWKNAADTITSDVVFTAQYDEGEHELFIDPASKAATCTQPGIKAEYCECGYRYEEELPARGHDWQETGRTAFCTTEGTIDYKCKRAGCPTNATKQEKLDPTGHTFSGVTERVAPTCTEIGYEAYKTCSACNLYFAENADSMAEGNTEKTEIPAVGHNYGTWIEEIPAACEEAGTLGHYHCDACNKDFDAAKNVLSSLVITAKGHNYGTWITEIPATCEETGTLGHYHCDACNKNFDNNKAELATIVISAKGHNYGTIIPEVPATCVSTGVKAHYDCAACDKVFDSDKNELDSLVIEIDPDNHDLKTVSSKAPTCEDIGWAEYKECQREGCTYTTYAEIPATDHDYKSEVSTAATCIKDGVMTYICKNDSKHTYTEVIKAEGHKFTAATQVVAPGCTSTGMDSYKTCTVCNKYFSKDAELFSDEAYDNTDSFILDSNGHNYVPVVTPPTCEDQGYTTYTCSACNDSYKAEYVASLGHKEAEAVTEKDIPASCTVNGSYDEVVYCSVCDKELSRVTKVHTAPGHTEEVRQENNLGATCTTPGAYDNVTYCTVCNEVLKTEKVTGVTLPHTYTEKIVNDEHLKSVATCKAYAVYYYDCIYCDANAKAENADTFEYVAGGYNKNNHVLSTQTLKNDIAVTCYRDGYTGDMHYDCCNEIATKGNVISKDTVDHTPAEAVKEDIIAATCYKEGTYNDVVYCSVEECHAKISSTPKTTEKIAHTPAEAVKENIKDSTCYKEGSYDEVVYCSVEECHEKLSSEAKVIEKKEHTPAEAVRENVNDSTCYAEGDYEEVVYCSVSACHHEISRVTKAIEKKAHTPAEAVRENVNDSTCYAEGSYEEVIYCSVSACHHEISRATKVIEKKAHTPAEAVRENVNDSTCYAEGSYEEVIYCSVSACHHEISRVTKVIEKKAHTAGAAVVENEVAAKCEETGSYDSVVYCSVCKAAGRSHEMSRNTIIIPEKGHNPADAVVENKKAATCTENGSYDEVVYCSDCDKELNRATVTENALGHKAGETVFENEVNISCTTNGSHDEVVYCTVCGDEISRTTVTVTAPGHTAGEVVYENETPATETTNGQRDEVTYCTECGAEVSRVTVVTKIERTITFVMKDRTVTVKAYTGDIVTSPVVNSYTGRDGFVHTFKNWDKPVATVTGDATYTAVYTEPCDYTELDRLEETLNEILDGGLAEDSVIEANKAEIEKVLAQIEKINEERNYRDASDQNAVTAVTDSIEALIDVIYPDAGSTLVINGSSVQYSGTILDLKAVKMPIGTEVYGAEWTSSDEDIVFVSNGKLYAVGTGTVTITAKRGILTATKVVSVIEGGNVRGVTFTTISNSHFIVEDYYAVYNSARIYWSDDFDLRFRVRTYQNFMFDDYIVYINGVEATADADGYYVVPAGLGDARVTIAGAMLDTDGSGDGEVVTKWSLWEWLLNFFRKIVAFFQGLFN